MGELGWGPGSGRGRVTPPSIFPLDLHQPPSPCSFNCCGNFFKVCIVGGQRLSLSGSNPMYGIPDWSSVLFRPDDLVAEALKHDQKPDGGE